MLLAKATLNWGESTVNPQVEAKAVQENDSVWVVHFPAEVVVVVSPRAEAAAPDSVAANEASEAAVDPVQPLDSWEANPLAHHFVASDTDPILDGRRLRASQQTSHGRRYPTSASAKVNGPPNR